MSREDESSAATAPVQVGASLAAVVGREAELERVETFVTGGEGATTLLLDGEAGIGKTTLWNAGVELAERAGDRVLTCRPAPTETQLSYGALGDLVEPVLDDVLHELPAPQRWALDIALMIRVPEGPPPDQRALGLALLGVLRVLSRESPVLVAVDDSQWLDPASAATFEFVLRRVERPVRAIVAVRLEEQSTARLRPERMLSDEQLERVRVGPLSLGALHRLLRARLGASLPRPTLVRVHEASAGNPFYAIELARTLLQHEQDPEAGRRLHLPDGLDELVSERLELLPGRARDHLAMAAAMSDPTIPRLGHASGSAPASLLEDLDVAAGARIVEIEGDRVRFAHPLFASSVYWHAGEARRRTLHRRLAEMATDAEEKARHLALASVGPDEDVASALDQAANQAASRGATLAAVELAELAVHSTPESHEEELLRRRLGAAERTLEAGDAARARELLEELLAELAPGPERIDALLLLAHSLDNVDEQGQVAALALQTAGNDSLRLARIHRQLAAVAATRTDQRTALEHARAAAEAAADAGDHNVLASSLAYVGLFETFLEEITPGLLERAVEIEEDAGHLPEYESPRMVLGYRLAYQDRYDEARARLEEADARAVAHGDFGSRVSILLHLAEMELLAGRWQTAASHAKDGYALADQHDSDQGRSALLAVMARLQALDGRVEAARGSARLGIALAREAKTAIHELHNRRALSFVDLSLADYEAAARPLELLFASDALRTERAGLAAVLPDVIEVLVGLGDLERAGTLLSELETRAKRSTRPYLRMGSARSRGLVLAAKRDLEAALAALSDAVSAHERLPNPFERARTLLLLGELQRRSRQRRAARESLEAALAIFDELGAPVWADRARRELARIGGRAPSTGALTPTEERVAALVAEGRTNREAASALTVSEHTIEGHLSRIYAKLGLRSRAELAHRFAARPGEPLDS
jgi:DNA-binding CsgD family transcriptional regulator